LVGPYENLSRIKMESAATDKSARAEALRLSLKVLAMDSGNDDARYQAATVWMWDGDYRLSLEQLDKLSSDAKMQIGAEALMCADYARLDQHDKIDATAKRMAQNADLTEQDIRTCLSALRAGRRADLIEMLYNAVALHKPLSADGLRMLG